MSTPGERFAEAANELIMGIQKIQYRAHRPIPDGSQALRELALTNTQAEIAAICEALIGPYKIIVADLSHEDFSNAGG